MVHTAAHIHSLSLIISPTHTHTHAHSLTDSFSLALCVCADLVAGEVGCDRGHDLPCCQNRVWRHLQQMLLLALAQPRPDGPS
jgi:hypothetical protein